MRTPSGLHHSRWRVNGCPSQRKRDRTFYRSISYISGADIVAEIRNRNYSTLGPWYDFAFVSGFDHCMYYLTKQIAPYSACGVRCGPCPSRHAISRVAIHTFNEPAACTFSNSRAHDLTLTDPTATAKQHSSATLDSLLRRRTVENQGAAARTA